MESVEWSQWNGGLFMHRSTVQSELNLPIEKVSCEPLPVDTKAVSRPVRLLLPTSNERNLYVKGLRFP